MTSLLVWFAADGKKGENFKPASIYIASDSRVSWGDAYNWDCGKKVFASSRYPDVFAYCGDSLFAALVLGQVVGGIDSGMLFAPTDTAEEKMDKVGQLIRVAWKTYPAKERRTLKIVHCSRDGMEATSEFKGRIHSYSAKLEQWDNSQFFAPVGRSSGMLVALGTGALNVESAIDQWNSQYSDRHTSRALFSAFCHSLRSADADKYSGGPPQLVGLYRVGNGRSFGVIWNNSRYFEGLATVSTSSHDAVAWRNDTFEINDSKTRKRKVGAAIHSRTLL